MKSQIKKIKEKRFQIILKTTNKNKNYNNTYARSKNTTKKHFCLNAIINKRYIGLSFLSLKKEIITVNKNNMMYSINSCNMKALFCFQ